MDVRVDIGPVGSGRVEFNKSNPDIYPYTRTFQEGTIVTLEAIPLPGYHFAHWSGDLDCNENPAVLNVYDNKTFIANFIADARELASDDGRVSVTVPEGANAFDEQGNLVIALECSVNMVPPRLPPGADIIGLSYKCGPEGTTFDQPISMTLGYDEADIPLGVSERDLVIAYYFDDISEWTELPSVVDPLGNTVTASVEHFTTFAVIAFLPLASPSARAMFTPHSLSISPTKVNTSEEVDISVLVTNSGEEDGSYVVTLKINGVLEEDKEITLAGGQSKVVTFTTVKNEAGTYWVAVNGLSDSFAVRREIDWVIFVPVIGITIFLAIFIPFRLRKKNVARLT